ncbi:hypothetical protein BaRGS_00025322 [Batillaria attramentaria]|uniref:Right handed beta helix domain-containing protein n=1 Tax=Batillaria attramentaria TaxID=370345 RepID=A0ABD0K8I2_9CAEN
MLVDVFVELMEGYYYLTSTLHFHAAFTGTVVIRAYRGGEVHVIGGQRIPSNLFRRVTDSHVLQRLPQVSRDKVLELDLAAAGITDLGTLTSYGFYFHWRAPLEIFINGRPLRLAQWPNTGFINIKSVPDGQHGRRFTYDSGNRDTAWAQETEPWVYGWWYWSWADSSLPVSHVDPHSHTITLAKDSQYGLRVGHYSPSGPQVGFSQQGGYFRVINMLCEIDEPGEYYIDRTNNKLYVWPNTARQTLTSSDVVYGSMLNQCVRIEKEIHNLHFEDFTVEGCRQFGVDSYKGNDLTFKNMEFKNTGLQRCPPDIRSVCNALQDYSVIRLLFAPCVTRHGITALSACYSLRLQRCPPAIRSVCNASRDYSVVRLLFAPCVTRDGITALSACYSLRLQRCPPAIRSVCNALQDYSVVPLLFAPCGHLVFTVFPTVDACLFWLPSFMTLEEEYSFKKNVTGQHNRQPTRRQANTSDRPTRQTDHHIRQTNTLHRPTRQTDRHVRQIGQTSTSTRSTHWTDQHVRQINTSDRPARQTDQHVRQTSTSDRPTRHTDQHVTQTNTSQINTSDRPTRQTDQHVRQTNTSHRPTRHTEQHVTDQHIGQTNTSDRPTRQTDQHIGQTNTSDRPTRGDRTTLTSSEIVIQDNHMWEHSRCGAVPADAVHLEGVGVTVSYNHIHHGQYTGIRWAVSGYHGHQMGGEWVSRASDGRCEVRGYHGHQMGDGERVSGYHGHQMGVSGYDGRQMGDGERGNDHIIEYNHVHHMCWNSSDCGAIHSGREWTWRGNVIRHNHIHHTLRYLPGADVRGIMLDDEYSSVLIEHNVFYDNEIHTNIGGGRDNVVRYNVMYNATKSSMQVDGRGAGTSNSHSTYLRQKLQESPYQTPLWQSRYPELANILSKHPEEPEGNQIYKNVFYNTVGKERIIYYDNTERKDYYDVHDNFRSLPGRRGDHTCSLVARLVFTQTPSLGVDVHIDWRLKKWRGTREWGLTSETLSLLSEAYKKTDFWSPDNADFRFRCEALQWANRQHVPQPVTVDQVGPRVATGPHYLTVHRHSPAAHTTQAPVGCDTSTVAPATTAPRGSYLPDGSSPNTLYPNIPSGAEGRYKDQLGTDDGTEAGCLSRAAQQWKWCGSPDNGQVIAIYGKTGLFDDYRKGLFDDYRKGLFDDYRKGLFDDYRKGLFDDYRKGLFDDYRKGLFDDYRKGLFDDYRKGLFDDYRKGLFDDYRKGLFDDYRKGLFDDYRKGLFDDYRKGLFDDYRKGLFDDYRKGLFDDYRKGLFDDYRKGLFDDYRKGLFDDYRKGLFDDYRKGLFDDYRKGLFDDYRKGLFDDYRKGLFDDYRKGLFDDYRTGLFDDYRKGLFDDYRTGLFDDYRKGLFDDYRKGLFDDYRKGLFDDYRKGLFDDYRKGLFDDYRTGLFDDYRKGLFDDYRTGLFDDYRKGLFDDYRTGLFDDYRKGLFDDYRTGLFDDYRKGLFDDYRTGLFDDYRKGLFDDYRTGLFDDYRKGLFDDYRTGLFDDYRKGLFDDYRTGLFDDYRKGLFDDYRKGLFDDYRKGLFDDYRKGLFDDYRKGLDTWAEQHLNAANDEEACLNRASGQWPYCGSDANKPYTSIYRPTGAFRTAGAGCWIKIPSCPAHRDLEGYFYDAWGATNMGTDNSRMECFDRAEYYWNRCGSHDDAPVTAFYRPNAAHHTVP